MMDEPVFKIKSYGFSELAQLYLPNIGKDSAAKQFRAWIKASKALQTQLAKADYLKGQRLFTPKQVRILVEHLGEP